MSEPFKLRVASAEDHEIPLYPLIVNKYNRLLLCNHVLVSQLYPFPDVPFSDYYPDDNPTPSPKYVKDEFVPPPPGAVIAYQWYHGGYAIEGATESYYSENEELQGDYQLRIQLDDWRYVYSEIVSFPVREALDNARISVYDVNGILIREQYTADRILESLPKGMYFLRYEKNGNIHTEKAIVL